MNDFSDRSDRLALAAEAPRALLELAALVAASPFLQLAPKGDGHPVLVMPGFGGGDGSTSAIRLFLGSSGYAVEPWNLGTNLGPAMRDLPALLSARLDEIFGASSGRKVSLVGWSLGGVYARLMAQRYPSKVRQVVTLGSPFGNSAQWSARDPDGGGAEQAPAKRPFQLLRMRSGSALPGVPSSAIFSKSDAIVPWRIATQLPSPIADNIEVFASHIGLGVSPAVLYALADRLAQREGAWRPFERKGWRRRVFGAATLDGGPLPSRDESPRSAGARR